MEADHDDNDNKDAADYEEETRHFNLPFGISAPVDPGYAENTHQACGGRNESIGKTGAIIGMVKVACPEPDVTKKLNTVWNTYINCVINIFKLQAAQK